MDQNNFIDLSIQEVTTKLKILAQNKEVVKIWMKNQKSIFYRLCDILVLNTAESYDVHLSFFSEGEGRDGTLIGQHVYLSFHFNQIDYFAEGVMLQDETHDKVMVKLTGEVYRTEKRHSERLITFPHHQVYTYFKILKKSHDLEVAKNVIPIKSPDNVSSDSAKKKIDLKEKIKGRVEDTSDLFGFRTLDISKTGIAFVVGESEGQHFKENKKMSFYILFNNEMFLIKGAELVYKVDYLGAKDNKSFKVGLTYAPIEKLTHHLTSVLSETSKPDEAQREFENFLDK